MAIERKDMVLGKALPGDATAIPRYNILSESGEAIANNARLALANPINTPGTTVDSDLLNELLAASGTTAGSASALTLSQPGFILKDGASVRMKLHVTPTAGFTLNIQATGAKPVKFPSNENAEGMVAGAWVNAVYSQDLGAYIVSAGGGGGLKTAATVLQFNVNSWATYGGAFRAVINNAAFKANRLTLVMCANAERVANNINKVEDYSIYGIRPIAIANGSITLATRNVPSVPPSMDFIALIFDSIETTAAPTMLDTLFGVSGYTRKVTDVIAIYLNPYNFVPDGSGRFEYVYTNAAFKGFTAQDTVVELGFTSDDFGKVQVWVDNGLIAYIYSDNSIRFVSNKEFTTPITMCAKVTYFNNNVY